MENRQKTIAIIAPYFPPYGGGSERYAYEIAERLQKDGQWRVIFIASGGRRDKDSKTTVRGITVYRLRYTFKFSNTPFSFGWFRKIRKIFKEERPDMVNIHMPVPGIGDVASLFIHKKPLIVTYHGGSMKKGRPLLDLLVWLYEHGPLTLILNRANRIVCASNFVRFNFLNAYLSKSITITPGVDSRLFHPDIEKNYHAPSILFVAGLGNAEQHKGLHTLLDAMVLVREKIWNTRLTIVGDGDMREDYQVYAKKLNLENSVDFKGRLAGKLLAKQYQEADLLVLPSENESFGMVILEAMSAGLPVIATRIGGIPFLVADNKTGFLIEPRDPVTLARKIIELLTDRGLMESFGKAARIKAADGFDWDQRANAYDKLFKQLQAARTNNMKKIWRIKHQLHN
jgi:glycosyltransferase involved in cell wall biosynthesis